ncbi:MAG: transglutaminase family protein [Caldilineaceae bacterium]|nr:transglutaminase family protein [Caldilineaceae bacterium]
MAEVTDAAAAFAAELSSGSPERLALAIARVAYPGLQPEPFLQQLDQMAAVAALRVLDTAAGGPRALALIQAMRLDLGMRGNTERYYDAANSYLNIVLERRTGLPIMLSLILMAVGQRLGLDVEGAGFPGHFMARYQDEEGLWILDPFHGAVMTLDDVPAYFTKLFGQSPVDVDESHFAPVSAEAWAMRILNNLHAIYIHGGELTMLSKVVPLMLVLEPGRQELWQELGLVEYRRGELRQAARALRRYFFLTGHVLLNGPDGSVPPPPPTMEQGDREVWNLLAEIELALARWN